MRLPYREGTWFGVPLRQGGYAVGVVARATAKGKVILCYFFGPRRKSIPKLAEVEHLKPADAIRALRVGDLALIRGEWPIIDHSALWNRSEWVMPPLVRRDELSRKTWRVHYSDIDPSKVVREELIPFECNAFERDAMFGSGAAELVLTKLLK